MILITGSNGWLGLNLIKSICEKKTEKWGLKNDQQIRAFVLKGTSKKNISKISNDVEICEGDLLIKSDVESFLSVSQDGILIHTAGIIHPKKTSEFYKINLEATSNLLNVAKLKNIKKIIIISSNSPFGCNPNSSQFFDEQSPYNPYMNYGKSKMKMELLAKKMISEYKMDISIIRAPWFYGPFQPSRQKIFFEMIRKGKVPIVGNGYNSRSMVFTENLVQGIILAASKNISSGKNYWIADEIPYTMNQIVETIEKILEEKFGLECNHGRIKLPNIISNIAENIDKFIQLSGFYHQKIHVLSEMNKNISCSIDCAKKELNYQPEHDLESGMYISLKEIYELNEK